MADTDPSLYNLRYNQAASMLEAFGGGTPQWTQITLNNVDPQQVPITRLINTTAPLQGGGNLSADRTLSIPQATSSVDGFLLHTDWTTFNNKLTSVLASANLFVGNGSNIATSVTLSGDATLTNTGALTLNTVNGNIGTFMNAMLTVNAKGLITAASSGTIGNFTDAGTDGIIVTGGIGAVLGTGTSLAQHVADTTHNGYLSSTDWNTFNGKQAAGNYITALTGDVTATGPGSVVATFATVNGNIGSFTNASITVNAKGLITAAANGTTAVTAVTGTTNQINSTGGTTPVLSLSSTLVAPGTIESTSTLKADTIISAANGLASAPSYTFTTDTLLGMYRIPSPGPVSAAAANWNTSTHNITSVAHGLTASLPIQLTTTGTLPAGLSLATTYYIIVVDADTFALTAGADGIVKIAFTTQGTGTHTITATYPSALGFSVNNLSALTVSPLYSLPHVYIGGVPLNDSQPGELLTVYSSSAASSNSAQDITNFNTNNNATRFVAYAGGATPIITYVVSGGSGNTSTPLWSGGPSLETVSGVQNQNAANFAIYGVDDGLHHGPNQYWQTFSTTGTWHFVQNTSDIFTIGPTTVDIHSQKLVNLANGTASTDAAAFGQIPVITAGQIVGTATNDNASAGNVGQYVESVQSAGIAFAATGVWKDGTSISLTAGDWDVSCTGAMDGGTVNTDWSLGISQTAGNSTTGLVFGNNWLEFAPSTATIDTSGAIPAYRQSLSGTTTIYLKMVATYAGTTPTFYGRISARRVR